MATIIELNNGRLKRVSNRLHGNTGNTGKRLCRYDNDIEMRKLRRVEDRALRQQIEECDLIGPNGLINSGSSDYTAPRKGQQQRPRRDQRFNFDRSPVRAQASTASVAVVAIKPKRPAIKVFIDENGTMRARPVFATSEQLGSLMGAPAGYMGYDQGGLLTEVVTNRPYQVMLADEYVQRA